MLIFGALAAFFQFWHPCLGNELDSSGQATFSTSANVLHLIRGKVYLDKGIHDGVSPLCRVKGFTNRRDSVLISLDWCGDDLCSFINPQSGSLKFAIGQTVQMICPSDLSPGKSKVIIAYLRLPAWPHQEARDIFDREFRSLISITLDRAVECVPCLQRDSDYNDICLHLRENQYFSNGSNVRIEDLIFSLQSEFQFPISETYLLWLLWHDRKLTLCYNDTSSIIIRSPLPVEQIKRILVGSSIPLRAAPSGFEISIDSANPTLEIIDHPISPDNLTYWVASGPYCLVEYSSEKILLRHNQYYEDDRPYPDTLLIRIINDPLKQKLAFQRGELDLLEMNYAGLEKFGNAFKIVSTSLPEIELLSLNNQKKYLSDGILSAALSYMIDRQALCEIALGKHADPRDNLFPDQTGFPAPFYDLNRAKGKALLRRLKNIPKNLTILINPDDFLSQRTAEYLQGILERENLYLQISASSANKAIDSSGVGQYDLMLSRIDICRSDPLQILSQISFHPELDRNRSLFWAETFDSTILAFLQSPEGDQQILAQSYRRWMEFPFGIILYSPRREIALGERIGNVTFTPQGFIDFAAIELNHGPEK